tara:strand:- start:2390 stop:2896 length:507 start_codon:yes stop_codon:yes gene_type:complete
MSYEGSSGKPIKVPDARPENYSGIPSTYKQGEGHIFLSEIKTMDVIRLWLKPYHALAPGRRNKSQTLEHVHRKSTGSIRGYQVTELQGSVSRVDLDNKLFEVNVSPGGQGFKFIFSGVAYVPWESLRRAEIVRPRIIDGQLVPRFPFVLPIVFELSSDSGTTPPWGKS